MSDLLLMTTVKATLVKALKQGLAAHSVAEFVAYADRVSIEFPVEQQAYPSFWVDFDPAGSLRTVGVGHLEHSGSSPTVKEIHRWAFEGRGTFTVVAMTSLERDRLVDALISTLAFSASPAGAAFRSVIEGGQYVGLKANFDEIDPVGFASAPGTPWGTDDMMYEGTLALDLVGEFVSDAYGAAVALADYEVIEFEIGGSDPDPSGSWFHEVPYAE